MTNNASNRAIVRALEECPDMLYGDAFRQLHNFVQQDSLNRAIRGKTANTVRETLTTLAGDGTWHSHYSPLAVAFAEAANRSHSNAKRIERRRLERAQEQAERVVKLRAAKVQPIPERREAPEQVESWLLRNNILSLYNVSLRSSYEQRDVVSKMLSTQFVHSCANRDKAGYPASQGLDFLNEKLHEQKLDSAKIGKFFAILYAMVAIEVRPSRLRSTGPQPLSALAELAQNA